MKTFEYLKTKLNKRVIRFIIVSMIINYTALALMDHFIFQQDVWWVGNIFIALFGSYVGSLVGRWK